MEGKGATPRASYLRRLGCSLAALGIIMWATLQIFAPREVHAVLVTLVSQVTLGTSLVALWPTERRRARHLRLGGVGRHGTCELRSRCGLSIAVPHVRDLSRRTASYRVRHPPASRVCRHCLLPPPLLCPPLLRQAVSSAALGHASLPGAGMRLHPLHCGAVARDVRQGEGRGLSTARLPPWHPILAGAHAWGRMDRRRLLRDALPPRSLVAPPPARHCAVPLALRSLRSGSAVRETGRAA